MAPATNVEDLYAQVHKQKVNELSGKDIKLDVHVHYVATLMLCWFFSLEYWSSWDRGSLEVSVEVCGILQKERSR